MKTIKYLFIILTLLIGLTVSEDSLETSFHVENEQELDNSRRGVVTPVSVVPPRSLEKQESKETSLFLLESGDVGFDEVPPSSLRPRLGQDISQVGIWPFSSSSAQEKNLTSDACAGQTDCTSCYAKSSWCHWCENQNACHSKGSVYGCFSGSECKKNHTVDPDDQHGCAAHQTCSECSTASRFCHWCAHDQACHNIGSVYGCAVGVDCFSNDMCKRKAPQKIKQHFSVDQLNALPIAIVMAVAVLCCCCTSICFCICSGVKGAYDDLADLSANHEGDATEPLLLENHIENDYDPIVIVPSPAGEENEDEQRREMATEESFVSAVEEGEAIGEDGPTADEEVDNGDTYPNDQPLDEDNVAVETAPLLMDESTTSVRNVRRSIRPRRPRHMQRLCNGCRACYMVTILLMCTMVFCSIWFYPKIPVYNICNDNVAWKSIIESMESLHTKADIEILGSIVNPNHVSAILVNGTGTFSYKNKFVGTFTIPPFTAEAMAITDFVLIAHLTPGAWDGIAIAKDFSLGKLVLTANASAVVRIPALADLTVQGGRDKIMVYVNEIQDRSLCACPSWDEAKNHTDPPKFSAEIPLFEQA
mmetsp:Transcript_10627/g.21737  ORF Transcript_10627/g.21737 Transcript_10627/m.21737 type:complete len:590 (+) Transcript_10627:1374-3143(+)